MGESLFITQKYEKILNIVFDINMSHNILVDYVNLRNLYQTLILKQSEP